MSGPDSYYYADGRRITLRPVKDLIAFAHPTSTKRLPTALRESLAALDKPLLDNISMVPVGQLSLGIATLIHNHLSVYPIYTGDGGELMISLPEIRVEYEQRSAARIEAWLADNAEKAKVVRHEDGQLVLIPKADAENNSLEIANDIYEKTRPLSAQPRFLRVVPRPNLQRPLREA